MTSKQDRRDSIAAANEDENGGESASTSRSSDGASSSTLEDDDESLRPAGYVSSSEEDESAADEEEDDEYVYILCHIGDWQTSPNGQWRFRGIITRARGALDSCRDDCSFFTKLSFELRCINLPIVIKSYNIRLTHGHKTMGVHEDFNLGTWKGSGWDSASWVENSSSCLHFRQTVETDETICPDVFVSLPCVHDIDSNDESAVKDIKRVRAAFVPDWKQENASYFPQSLRRDGSVVESVFQQLDGFGDGVATRISQFYMELLGNDAKYQELKSDGRYEQFFDYYM